MIKKIKEIYRINRRQGWEWSTCVGSVLAAIFARGSTMQQQLDCWEKWSQTDHAREKSAKRYRLLNP